MITLTNLFDLFKASKRSTDDRQMSFNFDALEDDDKPATPAAKHKESVQVHASTKTNKKTGEIIPIAAYAASRMKKEGEAVKPENKPYFTMSAAKNLIGKNYSQVSDDQLQKDYVKLRDFNRFLDTHQTEKHSAEQLLQGGYFSQVSDPNASGLTPKDPWIRTNLKYTLDLVIEERNKRTKPSHTPPAKPKEPWEMTQSDFKQMKNESIADSSGKYIKKYLDRTKGGKTYGERIIDVIDKHHGNADHRMIIEQAIHEGKPVPDHVLADYPELKQGKKDEPLSRREQARENERASREMMKNLGEENKQKERQANNQSQSRKEILGIKTKSKKMLDSIDMTPHLKEQLKRRHDRIFDHLLEENTSKEAHNQEPDFKKTLIQINDIKQLIQFMKTDQSSDKLSDYIKTVNQAINVVHKSLHLTLSFPIDMDLHKGFSAGDNMQQELVNNDRVRKWKQTVAMHKSTHSGSPTPAYIKKMEDLIAWHENTFGRVESRLN